MQVAGGRHFMHEHPTSASSWQMPEVAAVAELAGVQVVTIDLCRFGMMAKDDDGKMKPVQKPTRIMTNAPEIVKRVNRRCPNRVPGCGNKHDHTLLVGGKARKAQIYPREFCKCVCVSRHRGAEEPSRQRELRVALGELAGHGGVDGDQR